MLQHGSKKKGKRNFWTQNSIVVYQPTQLYFIRSHIHTHMKAKTYAVYECLYALLNIDERTFSLKEQV